MQDIAGHLDFPDRGDTGGEDVAGLILGTRRTLQ